MNRAGLRLRLVECSLCSNMEFCLLLQRHGALKTLKQSQAPVLECLAASSYLIYLLTDMSIYLPVYLSTYIADFLFLPVYLQNRYMQMVACIHTSIHTDIHTCGQTDRQTDRPTGKQTQTKTLTHDDSSAVHLHPTGNTRTIAS